MRSIKFLFLIGTFTGFYSLSALTQFKFIGESGQSKNLVADVIKALDINLETYKQEQALPTNHIFNAYNFLKHFYQDGNYQNRQEFYRRGGKPDYCLSKEQALQILLRIRGQFALHQPQDPKAKTKADAVICAGVDWSLDKRIFSFEKFLEAGFDCDNVFFLSRTIELDQSVKRAIERHKDLFKGKKLHTLYVPYLQTSTTHEDFIVALKPLISKEFYLISDPEYAGILLETFAHYANEHDLICLGEFVRPITSNPDEYVAQDIKAYKFDEFITTQDEQLCAAAYGSLGQLGHQVFHEIKLFAPDYKT